MRFISLRSWSSLESVSEERTNVEAIIENPATRTQFQSKVASELWLRIANREFRLIGKLIRIGRAPDNDIVLDDKSISRYHAMLSIAADGVVLEDLKSRNGTKVNGSRVKRAELADGDSLEIGDLPGGFSHRLKEASVSMGGTKNKPRLAEVSKIVRQLLSLKEKFERTNKRQRMIALASGVAALFVLLMIMSAASGPSMAPASTTAAQQVGAAKIVQTEINQKSFERCRELEDLGNLRQARACFKDLPLTLEVKASLDRIYQMQDVLSQARFSEGKQAFDNYYYDIAIQKWQEVVLIADDDSKFLTGAMQGIAEAEQKKLQQ